MNQISKIFLKYTKMLDSSPGRIIGFFNISTNFGAGGGSRTHTDFHPRDFKSRASAIPPHQLNHLT